MCLYLGRLTGWLTVVFVRMTVDTVDVVGSLAARDHTPRGHPTSLYGTSVSEAYLDVTLSNPGWNFHIRNDRIYSNYSSRRTSQSWPMHRIRGVPR